MIYVLYIKEESRIKYLKIIYRFFKEKNLNTGKGRKLMKKFCFYLLRWQLSTPILALVLILLKDCSYITSTIVANFIGGCIFFWVDKWIFKDKEEGDTI